MWKKFWNDKKGIIILILVLTVVSLSAAAFFANKNGKQMKADSDITAERQIAEEKKETAKKQQEEKKSDQNSSQQSENKSIQSSGNKEKTDSTNNKKVASSNVNTQEKSKQPENPKKSFIDKVVDKITGNDDKKPEDTKIKQYKVTFYTEGGSKLEARKVNKGTKIGSLPTPLSHLHVSGKSDPILY